MTDTPEKIRTPKQNNSEHKLFEEVAVELNNHGISMKALIENLEINHTKYSVKAVFRAIGKAKFGKDSTAKLTTKETQECYEEFNRMLSSYGIFIAWPSVESSPGYLSSLEYETNRI